MLHQLVAGQEAVVRTARKIFAVAERAGDQVTLDLLTKAHEGPPENGLDAAEPSAIGAAAPPLRGTLGPHSFLLVAFA
jgi:hypothetical protein